MKYLLTDIYTKLNKIDEKLINTNLDMKLEYKEHKQYSKEYYENIQHIYKNISDLRWENPMKYVIDIQKYYNISFFDLEPLRQLELLKRNIKLEDYLNNDIFDIVNIVQILNIFDKFPFLKKHRNIARVNKLPLKEKAPLFFLYDFVNAGKKSFTPVKI